MSVVYEWHEGFGGGTDGVEVTTSNTDLDAVNHGSNDGIPTFSAGGHDADVYAVFTAGPDGYIATSDLQKNPPAFDITGYGTLVTEQWFIADPQPGTRFGTQEAWYSIVDDLSGYGNDVFATGAWTTDGNFGVTLNVGSTSFARVPAPSGTWLVVRVTVTHNNPDVSGSTTIQVVIEDDASTVYLDSGVLVITDWTDYDLRASTVADRTNSLGSIYSYTDSWSIVVDLKDVVHVVRQYPRDDQYGLGSGPRLHPPPRRGRVIGGIQ